jgi:predicted Fe-Mo cluster-binding NifX family protein
MKVCFPVLQNKGLESELCGHFGSAPAFIIVETADNTITTINNNDQQHAHGACDPLKKFNNDKIDALVVGGLGFGALQRLNQAGIKVFQAQAISVKENLEKLQVHSLYEFTAQQCCAGHGQGSGCSH